MEKNANYALVGLSTLILFVGLVVFSVWLARLSFMQDYTIYDIRFQGPVRGLSQGGEAHFNGIKVGDVTKIALDSANPNQVIATVRMASNVPVRVDSYATLEPQGITGVNYVQITAGTPSKPLLKDVTPKGQTPVIRSQRSALSDLLEGGGTVLARTVEALDRVNRVLSEQNIKAFSATIADTQAITAELRQRKDLIGDAQKALQDIDAAAVQLTALSKSGQNLLDGEGARTVKSLGEAADEARATASEARGLISRLQGPASDFSTNGLPQITSAVSALQSAAESLQRLVDEVESNPSGVVAKPSAKELEVKP